MHPILIALLAVPILYLSQQAFKELFCFLRLQAYKRAGIKHTQYVFWPLGLRDMKKRFKTKDLYSKQKQKLMEFSEKQPFYVVGYSGICVVVLLSHQAVAEFYSKEVKYTIKDSAFSSLKFMGFSLENGKKAQEGRATFSKIFHYSNVISLMPQMLQIVKQHVKNLKTRVRAADGRLKVDLKKELLLALFDDLTGCILLRGADNKIEAKFEGMNISQILKKMFLCYFGFPRNPVNKLPFAERLGLSKEVREFKRLQAGFNKIIADQYRHRYNSEEKEGLADTSVLDIMVKNNKESEKRTGKPQYSLEEISSNFEVFQFAASDTSFQASCSCLTLLAQPENQKFQKILKTEILENYEKTRKC